jgi:SAM-dependent MidA family methyltransferase
MNLANSARQPTADTFLREEILRADGWLSFESFMATALYAPDFGYYTARIRDVGRTGDFSTSAHTDSLLGQALARWARHHRPKLPPARRWHLIEIGGGNGQLAATILRHLGIRGRWGLTYHLVEVSAPLREKQKHLLRGHRVCWHDSAAEALAAAGGDALLFSNELVDAYPCQRLQYDGSTWHELGIAITHDRLHEATRPLSLEAVAALDSSALTYSRQAAPQIVEIHTAYRRDLQKTAAALRHGAWLTIDYGDTFPDLYYRQPLGTARGYFHHLRIAGMDLYTRPGQQDLTADVNFTDLQRWGQAAGLHHDHLETQHHFLHRWLGPIAPRSTDDARLLDPAGAGGAFRVLQQSRGLE